MLDRTQSPQYFPIESINFPKLESKSLSNGIPVHSYFDKNLSVFKLELVFNAGAKYANSYAVSYFLAKLLLGGTSSKNSSELVEAFDQYGGFIETSQNNDRLYITLHGLSIYFDKYLGLINEMITDSIIPEDEFEIQKQISLQSYEVNKEKTSFVASQLFKEQLFGETILGKSVTDISISQVSKPEIEAFYETHIKQNAFSIILTGNFSGHSLELLDQAFGKRSLKISEFNNSNLFDFPAKSEKVIEIESALQSSIRIGKVMFSRSHPDFIPFLVLNTLFGGYFGSRLMNNIREDKGFTYGINSSLVSMFDTGYFVIGTDVKKENTQETIDEIFKEIRILQSELVSEEELDLVKNYMKGSLAGSLNTAFEITDKHKMLMFEGLDASYYDNFLVEISSVSAIKIQELALKYLDTSTLTKTIVGGL
jgi:zinc protease